MNKTDILAIREFALGHVASGFPKTPYRQAGNSLLPRAVASSVAERSAWKPSADRSETVAEQFSARIVMMTYEHPEGMYRPNGDSHVWTDAAYAKEQQRHEWIAALRPDTERRLHSDTCMLCDLLDVPYPAWLRKLTVEPDVPFTPQVLEHKGKGAARRAYWRAVLEDHYARICEKHGTAPSIAQTLQYLKGLNDPRIGVQLYGEVALEYETDASNRKKVKRGTVSTFLSELAHDSKV